MSDEQSQPPLPPHLAGSSAPPPAPEAPAERPLSPPSLDEDDETTRVVGPRLMPLHLDEDDEDELVLPTMTREAEPQTAAPAHPAPTVARAPVSGLVFADTNRRASDLKSPFRRSKEEEGADELVGLSLGSSCLRASVVREGLLVRTAEQPLPPGVIERGHLKDAGALTAALQQMWKRERLAHKEVNFSLKSRELALRAFRLPRPDNRDTLYLAIRNLAGTILGDVDPKKAVIDFAEISRGGTQVQLQLAAADRQRVDEFASAIEKAGLTPLACEIGPLAQARAMTIPRHPEQVCIVVDVGAETTSFTIASGPDLYFLRILDIGGNDFTRQIAKDLEVSFEDADLIKRHAGLGADPVDPRLDADTFASAQASLLGVLDQLAQMIEDSRRFYQGLPDAKAVQRVIVVGGTSEMAGFNQQLELSLELPVQSARPKPGYESQDFIAEAEAIGLAYGQQMSLIPPAKAKPFSFTVTAPPKRHLSKLSADNSKASLKRVRALRQMRPETNPKLIALAIAVAFAILGYWQAGKIKSDNDTLKGQLDTQLADKRNFEEQIQAPRYQAAQGDIAPAQQTANWLVQAPAFTSIAGLDEILAANGAEEVTLTAAGQSLRLQGVVPDDASATQIATDMASLPLIADISKAATTTSASGQNFVITFRLPNDPLKAT